jgi:surfeit locus 1 family protein
MGEQQFLIDNIVKNGQLGVYVVTPFEFSVDEALLIVNRGWLPKQPGHGALPNIAIDGQQQEIRGKTGNLPRVGIRPGEAFEGSVSWPRLGVYPTLDELSSELERDVLPFVLLLDPEEGSRLLRDWEPVQSGPATHYGYAFQWFAMAVTVLVISLWHLRKRRGDGIREP